MVDLEELLRKRQDELRGRPEDWIDRFGVWRRNVDWHFIFMVVLPITALTIVLVAIEMQ